MLCRDGGVYLVYFGFLHNSYQSIETRVSALTQTVTEAPM